MDGGAFGGVVGKVALGVAHHTAHGGNHDHGGGKVAVGFRPGLEEREEGDGGEVD